jgi:hypothetical protein
MSIVLVGSTSGSITLQEPAVAGTTVLTLPAVSGTVLTDTSPKAGNVLQVVQAINTTVSDYTTATPTLKVSLSITPSSTSSKIMLFYNVGDCSVSSSTSVYGATSFYRNGSSIRSVTEEVGRGVSTLHFVIAGSFLDSPSSTSALTYAVYHWNKSATGLFRVSDSGMPAVLTAMEIAG